MKKIFFLLVSLFINQLIIAQIIPIEEDDDGPAALVPISGANSATINQTKTYSVTTNSGFITSGSWNTNIGIITNQSATSVTIKWTSAGNAALSYIGKNNANLNLQGFYTVTVTAPSAPATPSVPTQGTKNCSGTTLQRSGTPPSGVTWYWQGTLFNGINTSNASSSYLAVSPGRYYIRARNNSTGVWSTASSSTFISTATAGGSTWYADTDTDGLGDPNIFVVNCNQPLGYVANANDDCPDEKGTSSNNGCPTPKNLSNQNYTQTTTYKKAFTVNTLNTALPDDKMEAVQYYDGFGRIKQAIAIRAGGSVTTQNKIVNDWTLNATATPFYNRNGATAENKIINGTTPFGTNDLLWECKPDATSNADGGWNSDYFTIDNTKVYRYTVWVKKNKVGGAAQGRTYHGIQNVNNLNGTANGNPYFKSLLLPDANQWYLLVGVVYPHAYSGTDQGVSGVYDIHGNKIADGTEFKWRSNTTQTRLRDYLYYTTDTSVRQYFWSPLLQKLDGTELSIKDVLERKETLAQEAHIKDIVTHYQYDALGRQTKEYLPYANGNNDYSLRKGNVEKEIQNYYLQKYEDDFSGITNPEQVNAYAEKVYEASPLNRLLETAAPGAAWKANVVADTDHTTKLGYAVNTATNTIEKIKWFKVTLSSSFNPSLTINTSPAYYPLRSLYKIVTKDENWTATSGKLHTTEVFKNKFGQTILKRTFAKIGNTITPHDTHYVYDVYNNLTYVIPPKVTIEPGVSNTELNELCFQYRYDKYNRLIEKKLPGKGWEYIVYDKIDRPVMTQDTNLDAQNKWLITKYDALGRVAYTGYQSNSSSRASLQIAVDHPTTYTQYEQRQTTARSLGGASIYYTSTAIPQGVTRIYTVNYYDTYIDLPTGLTNSVTTSYGQTSTTNTKSLSTVSKERIIGTNYWITTVTYYDEKARPIYVYTKNEYLKTVDIIESKLDGFTGKVLETKATHKKTGKADLKIIDRFNYDHMDRLVNQTQQINNQEAEGIVKNNYDELGQLESKYVGNSVSSEYKDVTSGLTISNNVITKTGATGWSHGLATKQDFLQDGYVEFIAKTNNKNHMVGLSVTNPNASYTTINYAIYCRSNGKVSVYESRVHKGYFGNYTIGDLFKIERIGNKIHYKKNGNTFYISKIVSSGSLLGDISMSDTGAKIKELKIVDNNKGLQKVDYNYNIRGWLTNINNVDNIGIDLFSFKINYNQQEGTEKYDNQYNGNISQTIWRTANVDKTKRDYSYKYDALNRITAATGAATSNYDLNAVTYDKNGNISILVRSGHINNTASVFGFMDALVYSYDNGNKLLNVEERENKNFGFKDGANAGDDFVYDANGNMTRDLNKGIRTITYNYLNLPTKIDFGGGKSITYIYSASGAKMQKKKVDGSTSTTDYAGGFIYENNSLKHFSTPEGYAEKNGSSFTYIYQYVDHLGNVRLNYTNVGTRNAPNLQIREENNYYPFGSKHKGYNNGILGNQNDFKYNGKEYQDEVVNGKALDWYDYGARNYDATLGRFFNVDPLADSEMQFDKSPFAYVWNNPLRLTDPDGMHPEMEEPEEDKIRKSWEGNGASNYFELGAGASIGNNGVEGVNKNSYLLSTKLEINSTVTFQPEDGNEKNVNGTQIVETIISRTDKTIQDNMFIFDNITKIFETIIDKNLDIVSNNVSIEKSTTVIGRRGKVLKEMKSPTEFKNIAPSNMSGIHLKSVTQIIDVSKRNGMAVIPLAKENYTAISRYLPTLKLMFMGVVAKQYLNRPSSDYTGQVIYRNQTFTGLKKVPRRKFLRLKK